ncbi:hypothetical protein C4K68_02610, partial [Pokkaliibacter plantistimulans]
GREASADTAMLAVLRAVVGQRGGWLAALNPHWHYLSQGVPDEQADEQTWWQDGNQEQRLQWLQLQRRRQPEQARAQLQAGLARMGARERSALVSTLAVNLGADDEALLQSLLRDRSKEVRQVALGLLCALPDSQLVQRAQQRMAALLYQERALLRQHWHIRAPEHCPADWQQDGIEALRPAAEGLGEKAWWLCQLAAQLPLRWWQLQLDMSPQQLIEWAQAGDWQQALLRAWYQAAVREQDADWAAAWLRLPERIGSVWWPDRTPLAALLPLAEQGEYWLDQLAAGSASRTTGEALARLNQHYLRPAGATSLAGSTELVSEAFVRRLFLLLREAVSEPMNKWDYRLRTAVLDTLVLVPHSLLPLALQGWPDDDPQSAYFQDTFIRMQQIARLRLNLAQLC